MYINCVTTFIRRVHMASYMHLLQGNMCIANYNKVIVTIQSIQCFTQESYFLRRTTTRGNDSTQNAPSSSRRCWWWLPSGLVSQPFRRHMVSSFVKDNHIQADKFFKFYSKILVWKFKTPNLPCQILEKLCDAWMHLW